VVADIGDQQGDVTVEGIDQREDVTANVSKKQGNMTVDGTKWSDDSSLHLVPST